jgi:hypothetical protein
MAGDESKSHSGPADENAEPTSSTGGTLLAAMTGKASPAKASVGDKPVFAYIASLPQPQRGIAEAIDTLAARTLPDLQRSVKWGMAQPAAIARTATAGGRVRWRLPLPSP